MCREYDSYEIMTCKLISIMTNSIQHENCSRQTKVICSDMEALLQLTYLLVLHVIPCRITN